MTKEELNAHLLKFPTILRNVLDENSDYKEQFLEEVVWEYKDIPVYRAIHRPDSIEDDDFICNIEEAKIYNAIYKNINLYHYAVSVNENKEVLKKGARLPNKKRPLLGIAKGVMKCVYGPADFEDETAVHHNWYLYKEAANLQKELFTIVESYDL